jgi:transcriptional regulator with XRE-family HTH domain
MLERVITQSPGDAVAANVAAARARRRLGQEDVAARMRALGYSKWVRQTVGDIETGRRRLLAEEVFALAAALKTAVTLLVGAVETDELVLPSGVTLEAAQMAEWDGNTPKFPES